MLGHVGVRHNGDKVLILLDGRRRDVLLSCAAAEEFAQALRRFAATAELETPELIRGETWEIGVQSYDGYVAVRFHPPTPGNPRRVPLPPAVARALADRTMFKAQQAAYRMRLQFTNNVAGRKRTTDPTRRGPWQTRRKRGL